MNPDDILRGNNFDANNKKDHLRAGKIAVRQINRYFEKSASFTHETVFSALSSLKRIEVAKKFGYRIVLNYVGLKNYQLAVERIANRVQHGGYDISANLVKRRWGATLDNLVKARDLCDEVHVFDNTELLKEVAIWNNGTLCWWGVSSLRGSWLADALLRE